MTENFPKKYSTSFRRFLESFSWVLFYNSSRNFYEKVFRLFSKTFWKNCTEHVSRNLFLKTENSLNIQEFAIWFFKWSPEIFSNFFSQGLVHQFSDDTCKNFSEIFNNTFCCFPKDWKDLNKPFKETLILSTNYTVHLSKSPSKNVSENSSSAISTRTPSQIKNTLKSFRRSSSSKNFPFENFIVNSTRSSFKNS